MPDGPASWQAIQAEVLHRIRSREWPPGGLIPNEADLAERTTWIMRRRSPGCASSMRRATG